MSEDVYRLWTPFSSPLRGLQSLLEHITLRPDPVDFSRLPGFPSHRPSANLPLHRSLTTMMRTSTQRVQGMRSTKAKPKPVTAMSYEELQQALQRNLAVLSNR